MSDSAPEGTAAPRGSWFQNRIDAGFFLSVVILAGWQLVPGENEAHYLVMARHYWQPQWCPGDILLESAPIHQAFYFVFGKLTAVCSLNTAAWMGRCAVWTFFAAAFWRLSYKVVALDSGLVAMPALCVFAAGNIHGHLSGEWVLGGVEAKTLAYPLLFWALGSWLDDRPRQSLIHLSAATAFHPLVGGWGLLTWTLTLVIWERPVLREFWSARYAGAIVAAAALCAIGVLPPLAADWNTPAEVRSDAWRILVQNRIPHHLIPWAFGWRNWLGFAAVAVLALILHKVVYWRMLPENQSLAEGESNLPDDALRLRSLRQIVRFTLVAAGLSLVGLLLAAATQPWPGAQSAVLRFYWFRQIGVVVPLCAGLLATRFLNQPKRPSPYDEWIVLPVHASLCAVMVHAFLQSPIVPPAEWPTPDDRFIEWREACEWVRVNAPADAVFITPRLRQTFKWYAQRAEVATWKDVPQDAAHVVPWWRRLLDLHTVETPSGREWIKSLTQHSPERLRALGERYGAEYLICGSQPALNLPCLYRHDHYAVYRLAPEPPAP